MGFDLGVSIPAFTVFIQGLLSFFSPCILPLVPLYIGYLSGGTVKKDENGNMSYSRKTVMTNTLFFILGISFAFLLLSIGFTAVGQFFSDSQMLFARIGGILIVLFGFYQLGWLGKLGLEKEHRLSLKIDTLAMNPITALVMGFTFSFAWTPCVGPALSTVLIMASSAKSAQLGFVLMAVYTLGFVLPFLAVGMFTTSLLNLFKKYSKAVAYSVKIGGVLMILMGVMMFTGWMNNMTGYLSELGTSWFDANDNSATSEQGDISSETPDNNDDITDNATAAPTEEENDEVPAIDFTLEDQFGNTHTLSDYEGKVVFLNFWATWCPPCKEEMPDIQKLYEKYDENEEYVIILGVASPYSDENQYTQEQTQDKVIEFLMDNEYTYPVVLDPSGTLEREYGITAFPTTFMIDIDGNVYGYLPGMMTYEIMESIIAQTIEGK